MDTINLINKNISQIIRHILPGFLVVAGLAASHTKLFAGIDIANGWHLLLLAVSAIVAGNTWFVFHRYGVHQFVDFLMYICGWAGPIPSKRIAHIFGPYFDDLAKHINESFSQNTNNEEIRNHVTLRASSMHLMYMASEISIFTAWWYDADSLTANNAELKKLLLWLGIVGFIVTLIQNIITRRVDWISLQSK